jgi:hypothetical protein
MKLQLVPASQGVQWVRQGIRTFFRQPLALTGLFFLFMAAMSVLSFVPLLGNAIALTLLPAATLGLMAATEETTKGKFPLPTVLISAFRAGRQRLRAMLVLGALYAAGFLLVMGLSTLVDGGKFASLYLMGGELSAEVLQQGDFQLAALVTMALYLPLSLLFWHAPALVHWHGISPVKSLFFSMVACLRNFWAFTLFGLVWMAVFLSMGLTVSILAAILGSPELITAILFPVGMAMAAMFFTSIYFTFQDSFEVTPGDPNDATLPPRP